MRRWVMSLWLFLAGCSLFTQSPDQALVRDPGVRRYRPPVPVAELAPSLWEYAALSSNVYSPADTNNIPIPGWKKWEGFPNARVSGDVAQTGLYVEAWQKTEALSPLIAVVFRGTDGASDWSSNLRWFLRFVAWYRDQYTEVATHVGRDFVEQFTQRVSDNQHDGDATPRIVVTGHSLGGGLAQYLAYSLPANGSSGRPVPRISRVYAFDPSPVTGWYSVEDVQQRTVNVERLSIDRIFEHGEILAYLRLLVSYVNPPTEKSPAIREIRFNFSPSINPLSSHGVRPLAERLRDASGATTNPPAGS